MILLIGKKAGMTLIEVLLSVTILTIGLLVLYRPFLTSLDAITYVNDRIEADRLLSHLVWEWERAAKESNLIVPNGVSGILYGNNKIFHYSADTKITESMFDLEKVVLALNWTNAGQKKSLSKEFYISLNHDNKEEQ